MNDRIYFRLALMLGLQPGVRITQMGYTVAGGGRQPDERMQQ
jgi:hypothetical protein